jgi:2-oxoglutarate ferredoxin oxidoreductase subunit beta
METSQELIRFFKEREISVKDAQGLSREEIRGKLIIGEFIDRELPEYTETYKELILVSQKRFKEPEKPGLAWIELEIRY